MTTAVNLLPFSPHLLEISHRTSSKVPCWRSSPSHSNLSAHFDGSAGHVITYEYMYCGQQNVKGSEQFCNRGHEPCNLTLCSSILSCTLDVTNGSHFWFVWHKDWCTKSRLVVGSCDACTAHYRKQFSAEMTNHLDFESRVLTET